MAYQLVEMMATDKKLQSSDFYPEYLIWKRLHYKKRPRTSDDIIAANAPSSKRKKTTGCVASKATITKGPESMPGTCNIDSNAGSNKLGLVSKELVPREAKILAYLQGFPGVPKLYEVVTEKKPLHQ